MTTPEDRRDASPSGQSSARRGLSYLKADHIDGNPFTSLLGAEEPPAVKLDPKGHPLQPKVYAQRRATPISSRLDASQTPSDIAEPRSTNKLETDKGENFVSVDSLQDRSDIRAEFVDASLFTSFLDADAGPDASSKAKTAPLKQKAKTARSFASQAPSWQALPSYKKALWTPLLFSRVSLDYLLRLFLGSRWLTRKWLSTRPGALTKALETLLWPLVFFGLARMSNPENPLYLDEGFPWPWLGVWLVALRYGALSALVGTVLLLGWWYVLHLGVSAVEFPRLYFLGGSIMALIAGEFGGLWSQRIGAQREAMRYLDERIERLTRRLYLLKLSHDELEFEMVERPATLRDALIELQGKLNLLSNEKSPLPGAQLMIEFWSAHCQIESAAMYQVMDVPNPSMLRVAHVGAQTPRLNLEDATANRALETGHAVHLLDQLTDFTAGDQALAAYPIKDANSNVVAVLAVFRMPFMAFNSDNLRNLGVFVDVYASWLRVKTISGPLVRVWPDAPYSLLQEYAWLRHIHTTHGVDSGCVLWHISGPQAELAIQALMSLHDNSTMAWRLSKEAVVSLSPFLNRNRLAQHIERASEAAHQQLSNERFTQVQSEILSISEDAAWSLLSQQASPTELRSGEMR